MNAFQTGKEYGNNGQCNPTYFTVGNLVQYLQSLRNRGSPSRKSSTATSSSPPAPAGPCRFGMYEAEYRLALRNSGFDGFRVLLFQQSGGLSQSDAEAGLEMNLDFFLGILNALNCGDVLNEVGLPMRPFEVERGRDRPRLDESMDYLHEVFRKKRPWQLEGRWSFGKYLGGFSDTAEYLGKFVDAAQGRRLHRRRSRAAATASTSVDVDRLRVKPIVKITGEFWAQTTEGDGNFNMFNFLRARRRAGAGGADRHLDHVHDPPGRAEVQGPQGPATTAPMLPPLWKRRHARQDRAAATARRSPS